MGKKIKSAAWKRGGELGMAGTIASLCWATWIGLEGASFLVAISLPLLCGLICEVRKAQRSVQ